ncbi:MAG TPA: universal stress protein [Trueperaceae bacterium]
MAELRDLPTAIQDFWRARRRANMREALSFLRPEPRLLSYEEVRKKLRAVEAGGARLEEVPLDAIVGSLGRYNDFTRGFLPRQDSDKERWARVLAAMTSMEGVPPIEVYRVGDAYFVKDGNHRVSVARQLGSKYIQAYVTPVRSRVKLTPDVEPDDLIIKAEEAEFLLETQIDELRPEADLTVTAPGSYADLREHISVHRYYMGIDRGREISYPEAVAHWYDTVYLPVVESIRKHGLLRGFPGRTETDLYLWLSEHRAALEKELGWALPTEALVQGVAEEVGSETEATQERRERALRVALGEEHGFERICADVLVALPSLDRGVAALEQALIVARREGSRLYGLHVTETRRGSGVGDRRTGERGGRERRAEDRGFEARSDGKSEVEILRTTFEERCCRANVPSQFAVAVGHPHERLLERSTWVDLVVAPLKADADGIATLSPGFRSFLRRCPRPVLTVNGPAVGVERVLLAYDGGPRANEALFVAAYVCAKWGIPLVVMTVNEFSQVSASPLEMARSYLDAHGIDATYIGTRGRVATAIVETAREEGCDTVMMGSYKFSRWLESMLGGVLEEVLRQFRGAVLVA